VWLASGSTFHYSDTWQLVINTGTMIVTFLMVFLIQNTQNRDAKAIHLKLDELIRGVTGARNSWSIWRRSPKPSLTTCNVSSLSSGDSVSQGPPQFKKRAEL
jgi:hypothetical protein